MRWCTGLHSLSVRLLLTFDHRVRPDVAERAFHGLHLGAVWDGDSTEDGTVETTKGREVRDPT
jgi:hypothetical protein